MKINRNINTTIITDNNKDILKLLQEEVVVSDISELKNINSNFIVFNDSIRSLSNKNKETLFNNMEERDIHFVNITSNLEEALYAHYIIVFHNGKIVMQGSTTSVLKEESILKRLGYRLPFVVDISLQLNTYGIIDSMFLDEEFLVDKLW